MTLARESGRRFSRGGGRTNPRCSCHVAGSFPAPPLPAHGFPETAICRRSKRPGFIAGEQPEILPAPACKPGKNPEAARYVVASWEGGARRVVFCPNSLLHNDLRQG
jgi:hypothetical protein